MTFPHIIHIIKLFQQYLYTVLIFSMVFSPVFLIDKTFVIAVQSLGYNQEIRNVEIFSILKRVNKVFTYW